MPFEFIDFSQFDSFENCPWLWFEKYITQLVPRREAHQRDDAQAIGSLVHAGLEYWVKHREPKIPEAEITEIGPTPEAFNLAEGMTHEYVRRYPEEAWEFVRTEEPIRFPLALGSPVPGLAKIDKYFYVPQQTTVESGIPGTTLDLAAGWWVHEYKTKDAQISRALWSMEWEVKRQADFQILALTDWLRHHDTGENPIVQGVLVQVLEKPRQYIPRRKCKGCGSTVELPSWLPAEGNLSACPLCGHKQELKAATDKAERPKGEFYRLVVTRTPEQLEIAEREIALVAEQMNAMASYGRDWALPTRRNCVFPAMHRVCDYFKAHTYNAPITAGAEWEHREGTRYVALEPARAA